MQRLRGGGNPYDMSSGGGSPPRRSPPPRTSASSPTPLHDAVALPDGEDAQFGRIAAMLQENHMWLLEKDDAGCNPLHLAARDGQLANAKVMASFLRAGEGTLWQGVVAFGSPKGSVPPGFAESVLTMQNQAGERPVDMAKARGNDEMVSMLTELMEESAGTENKQPRAKGYTSDAAGVHSPTRLNRYAAWPN